MRGEVETPGDWEALGYRCDDPSNIIRWADISDGGSGSSFAFSGNKKAAVLVAGEGLLNISESTVNGSSDAGIELEANANLGRFFVNVFDNNGGPGMRVYPRHLVQLDSATTYGGRGGNENGDAWIDVTDGSTSQTTLNVDVSGTWKGTDVPYRFVKRAAILSSVQIDIDRGARFLMSPGSGISVDGTLNFNGASPDSGIVVTRESESAGSWEALVFQGGSSSTMRYTTVEYGGSGADFEFSGNGRANIFVRDNASFDILTSTIQNSAEIGLLLRDGAVVNPLNPVLSGANTFEGNAMNVKDERP